MARIEISKQAVEKFVKEKEDEMDRAKIELVLLKNKSFTNNIFDSQTKAKEDQLRELLSQTSFLRKQLISDVTEADTLEILPADEGFLD